MNRALLTLVKDLDARCIHQKKSGLSCLCFACHSDQVILEWLVVVLTINLLKDPNFFKVETAIGHVRYDLRGLN